MPEKPGRHATRFHWTALIAYTVLLTVVSLLPPPAFGDTPSFIPFGDKIAHVLLYAVYAVLLESAFQKRIILVARPFAWAVTIAVTYGIVLEIIQACLPHLDRSGSLNDIAANLAGALAGAFAYRVWTRKSA